MRRLTCCKVKFVHHWPSGQLPCQRRAFYYQLEWHTMNNSQIATIRVWVTDGRNNILGLNKIDVALSIVIEEEGRAVTNALAAIATNTKERVWFKTPLWPSGKRWEKVRQRWQESCNRGGWESGEKPGKVVVQKRSDKIQQILRKRQPNGPKRQPKIK